MTVPCTHCYRERKQPHRFTLEEVVGAVMIKQDEMICPEVHFDT